MEKKRKNHRLEEFITENKRLMILLFNAVLILLVVIIAMGIQLYHLKHPAGPSGAEETLASSVERDQTASGQAKKADNKKNTRNKKNNETRRVVRRPAVIRKNLDPNKPMVALTFDDGPYSPVTDRIVKVLAKHNSRATFFVVGNRVSKYKEYAKSMKNAYCNGNQIATHTFDHRNLRTLKKREMKQNLARAFQTNKKVLGVAPTMIRPPGGAVNSLVKKNIGLPMIIWSVDSLDWSNRNTGATLERCKHITDGDIVLMHDLYPSTAAAVGKLVPRLRKRGYQLVTVEELFYYKGIKAKPGKLYYSGK